MKLYNYFRSSASFRVRIALQLKGIVLGVNLLIGAGADAMGRSNARVPHQHRGQRQQRHQRETSQRHCHCTKKVRVERSTS